MALPTAKNLETASIQLGRNDRVDVDMLDPHAIANELLGLGSDEPRDQALALAVLDEVQIRSNWLSLDIALRDTFSGIFDSVTESWTRLEITGQFMTYVAGGVPKDQKLIENWLRAKAGMTDEDGELRRTVLATMQQREYKLGSLAAEETDHEGKTLELAQSAAAEIATEMKGNGFKSDTDGGLYIEGRQPKAMIREGTNILFAGQRWGATKKGPRSLVAECLFVEDDRIYLGRQQPDMMIPFTGHVISQQGPRSTLTYYEICIQPTFQITLRIANDPSTGEPKVAIPDVMRIIEHCQWLGIGALRSQGFGTWKAMKVDQLAYAKPITAASITPSIRTV